MSVEVGDGVDAHAGDLIEIEVNGWEVPPLPLPQWHLTLSDGTRMPLTLDQIEALSCGEVVILPQTGGEPT